MNAEKGRCKNGPKVDTGVFPQVFIAHYQHRGVLPGKHGAHALQGGRKHVHFDQQARRGVDAPHTLLQVRK